MRIAYGRVSQSKIFSVRLERVSLRRYWRLFTDGMGRRL